MVGAATMNTETGQGATEATGDELSFDTSVAHPARRYDYWLGGKDNFAADRASGDAVAEAFPSIRVATIENRRFLGRVVQYLAGEVGIDQFLDIGTGIPSADNTHEVAQRVHPGARVVYVDNDPIVLAHARALLTSGPAGATAYIDADLRDPQAILSSPALRTTLDLTRPVALMLIAVFHFIPDEYRPYDLVAQLTAALPAGSYVVMSHSTTDHLTPEEERVWYSIPGPPMRFRSRDEVARFFDGHDLVDPGVVASTDWRPLTDDPAMRPTPAEAASWVGVARLHPNR
jgi:S-adenosyl methyltransferase